MSESDTMSDSDFVVLKDQTQKVPKNQNQKWKKLLSNSQLSELIVRVKAKYGLEETAQGFSWRDFKIEGVSVIPTAMDQEESELCIIYSSLALFKFQINLLCTEFEEARDLVPSKDYMIRVLNTLESKTSVDLFLSQLSKRNLTDESEFSKVKSLVKRQVKKFAVDYEYIEPELDDFVPATKEAIDVAGGVLFSMIVYKVDPKTKCPILEHGKKMPAEIVDYENPYGRKRKMVHKFLSHVVFGYGHGTIEGKTTFNYLNSYGDYNKKEGHDVCTDLSDICEVYVPQLAFNNSGFKNPVKARRRRRR